MKKLFPTLVSVGTLPRAGQFNRRLLADIGRLRREDKMGRQWSSENYRGGYTSYASASDLHYRFPSFMDFEKAVSAGAKKFGKAQGWDMRGLVWKMTSCWANVMGENSYHTSHLHPFSTLSGVYYVRIPKGSVQLKIEDPRLGLFMNAPVRKLYETIAPREGTFVLFESWLRHEVPPNQSRSPRVSISFNLSLEAL